MIELQTEMKLSWNIRLKITQYKTPLPLLKIWVQMKTFKAKNILVYIETYYLSEYSPLHLYDRKWLADHITWGWKKDHVYFSIRVMTSLLLAALGEVALFLLQCLVPPSKTFHMILENPFFLNKCIYMSWPTGCNETILSEHHLLIWWAHFT